MSSDRASGANHAIYAQFMAQSSMANKGRKVGLLRGAGTRMALWFYAMMCLLRLRQALMATIHQQKFTDLSLNETVAMGNGRARHREQRFLEVFVYYIACCIPRPSFASLL